NGACSSQGTTIIHVDDFSDATITPAGPFCTNDPALVLSAASTGGTWSGTGIVDASNGLFHPGIAGVGDHIIIYSITNGTCSDSDIETIHVDELLSTTISPVGPFCTSDLAIDLMAATTGGIWSGTGITDAVLGTFNPAIAGSGNHIITYEITNGACLCSSTLNIHVDDFYDATITPAGPFCNDDPALVLSAASIGGTWSGTGITNPATGVFNPAIAGVGLHTITYDIISGACSDNATIDIQVDDVPDASVSPAGPFCETDAATNLTAATLGGIWSGIGITDPVTGTFDPTIAGSGDFTITYDLTNGACSSQGTTIIHIDEEVDATITGVPLLCEFNPSFNLVAADPGGVWSGTGITNATNGTFDPTVAGPGLHTITYSITNGTCSDTDVVIIDVSADPDPAISGAGPFCSDEAAINLTSVTSGGVWTGIGITDPANGTFDPAIAGEGDHLITYNISIGICSNSSSITIHVDAEVDATITPVASLCQYDPATNLTSASAGGVWSGSGITDVNNGTFNPTVAGVGTVNITYSIVNGLCSDSDNIDIEIFAAPDATITDPGEFCSDDPSINLTAATLGGVWSGSGITDVNNGTFDPSVANDGANIITYTISNANCTSVGSVTINVYDAAVDGTITSTGPYCISDGQITLNAVSAGGVWSGNGIIDAINGVFDPSVAGAGTHSITYDVGNLACFDTDTQIIQVDDVLSAIINPVSPLCESSSSFDFTAANPGGVWSGTGITDASLGTFDPTVSGSGIHNITYTIIQGACTNIDSFEMNVDAEVDASIMPAGPFCSNEPITSLTAVDAGGVWSGTGIVNASTGLFHPSIAGAGDHIITYAIVNGTCSDSDTETIHVDEFQSTIISPAGPFCETDAAFDLMATTGGGTWSGTGITDLVNGTFDPAIAGSGNHIITYEITNGACFSS
ncbi:MAG: hypothetical protein M0P32_09120, partial [Bacteroidales bacterium]|nr:hypothetical protein [Bacteroidales bacterium]